MPLMCDVAYQRQKSSLHFGGFKVQAAFWGYRVGIYALAISGCLGHRTRGQRLPTLRLLAFFGNVGAAFMPTQVQAALGQRTRTCVPHTPYTSVLKFMSPTGRVCGAATHAVGGDTGCSLLLLLFLRSAPALSSPFSHNLKVLPSGVRYALLNAVLTVLPLRRWKAKKVCIN